MSPEPLARRTRATWPVTQALHKVVGLRAPEPLGGSEKIESSWFKPPVSSPDASSTYPMASQPHSQP